VSATLDREPWPEDFSSLIATAARLRRELAEVRDLIDAMVGPEPDSDEEDFGPGEALPLAPGGPEEPRDARPGPSPSPAPKRVTAAHPCNGDGNSEVEEK
jgi:hypothetical protein